MTEKRYNITGEECLKPEITVENLIDGDVFMSKSGVNECPRQVNILRRTSSKYFDKHHRRVKRKGIVFISVMAIIVIAIVILVKIIWTR